MLGVFKRLFGGGRRQALGEQTLDGVEVRIDRAPVVGSLDAPTETELGSLGDAFEPGRSRPRKNTAPETPLLAKPPVDRAALGMVSAALLAHKAKQIDDGLYAAVEL